MGPRVLAARASPGVASCPHACRYQVKHYRQPQTIATTDRGMSNLPHLKIQALSPNEMDNPPPGDSHPPKVPRIDFQAPPVKFHASGRVKETKRKPNGYQNVGISSTCPLHFWQAHFVWPKGAGELGWPRANKHSGHGFPAPNGQIPLLLISGNRARM